MSVSKASISRDRFPEICPASFSFQRVFEAFTIRSLLANPWLPSLWKSGPLGPAELKLAPSKSPVLRGHEWPLFHDKSSPKTKTHLPVLLAVGGGFRNFAWNLVSSAPQLHNRPNKSN